MRRMPHARSITFLLGVMGAALILLAFFLPYDMISFYSCAVTPPACPPYFAPRIDWTWQTFFEFATISLRCGFSLSFVILTIPVMLAVRIVGFQRGRISLLERVGRVFSILGLCSYLLFDGFHLLAFANLIPTMGHPPPIHAVLAPGFWLPIPGFLFCIISTFTPSNAS